MKIINLKYIIILSLGFCLNHQSIADTTDCIADFEFEINQELNKPSVIQFINTSSDDIENYNWVFSDGYNSNLKDPVHYFPQNGVYQVSLTVSNASCFNTITKTIEINVELNSDFTFQLDSNHHVPNTFHFQSQIQGNYDDLIWNINDLVEHKSLDTAIAFPEMNKEYQIQLTARYYFNDTSYLQSSMAKGLRTSEFYNLGGQVFLGDTLMNNPVTTGDNGIAYLYRMNQDDYTLVDTNYFTELGYYWFSNKIKADYLVLIQLENTSSNFNFFAPTYFGNTQLWEQAETISLDTNKYRKDIVLAEKTSKSSGMLSISGYVSDFIEAQSRQQVFIGLYDFNNTLLEFKLLQQNDFFSFNRLKSGHYIIRTDQVGVSANPQVVYISENNENSLFKLSQIHTKTTFFPNPAREYTLITITNDSFLKNTEVSVYTSYGQLLSVKNISLSQGINYIEFDLNEYPSGVLLFKFSDKPEYTYKLIHN